MTNYPLIKFVLFFICGYLLQAIFNLNQDILFYLSIISLAILFVFQLLSNESISFIKQLFILITIVIVSGFYYSILHKQKVSYPFSLPRYSNVIAIGEIKNIELIKNERVSFSLRADTIIINDNIIKKQINLLCSLNDSEEKLRKKYDSIKIGNYVIITGNIIKPRDKRNIGEFDYENYLNNRQIHALLNVYGTHNLKIISYKQKPLANLIFDIRKNIDDVLTKYHNKNTLALLRGLLLADRSLINYDIKNEFINTGVIHVLAVSGLHVGFISLIFIILFQRLNPYLKYSFTIFGLILFMIITGAPASVTRATIMAIVIIISLMTGRRYNSFNAIALSAFIILLINPDELFNSGFQLSFAAVISILVFYPILNKLIANSKINSKILKNILLYIAVSLAAQIGTIPLVLSYFNKLSIVSLIANLIIIPLIGFTIGLGLVTILVAFIIPAIANYYASANELVTYFILFSINKLNNFPYAYITVNQFKLFDSVIFYSCLLYTTIFLKKVHSIYLKLIVIFLIFCNLYLWSKINDVNFLPDNYLSIMAIDVGQGDSFLIKFPNGKTALIDAGNANKYFDSGKNIILPLLERLGINCIDYGFVSHIDADHCKGFYSLIKMKKIRTIYKPAIDSSDRDDVNFEKYLRNHSIPYKYYNGNVIKFKEARIYILSDSNIMKNSIVSSNERSGVIKLVYGNTSFLFTGDINSKVERLFVIKYQDFIKSNVLKVSHHGSRTGTSEIFLNYVKPDYAIISAGVANRFYHPHIEVLDRLKKRNIKIHRTDKEGAILMRSDGSKVNYVNWKKLDNSFIF
ncbi:DNA internalization-related competence protein ComEC/Rec2 [Rosettibacter firmus]|uniref:DNA internalization-related competence protein ComEC/Rec2 n=1 Tax=Rosettibacter firmus TaxID=3111522 RepID=UPI00336BBA73